jgi:hypothetical protein
MVQDSMPLQADGQTKSGRFRFSSIGSRLVVTFIVLVLITAAVFAGVTALNDIEIGRLQSLNVLVSVATLTEAQIDGLVEELE